MENILLESLKTSAIDETLDSNQSYQHRLLSNREEKIITTFRRELENCDEFIISVAFITEGGLTLILEELRELEKKGIRGRVLTGDYLNFTQPKALKKLLEFSNIDLRILSNEKFHAKGYFFRKGEMWTIFIGSSNLTQTALTVNFEWNLKINSLSDGKIAKSVIGEFEKSFYQLPKVDKELLDDYEKLYNINKLQIKSWGMSRDKKGKAPIPNVMQINALENLKKVRGTENKALLISATGTGKTYLSAFDVKEVNPKRVLFIAHRKTILLKAMETYKNVMPDGNISLYEENPDAQYVFAMVQTLSRESHLNYYKEDAFDYIIVDEVHHGGAPSYQKIINYFKPKFLLGMTATPERSDNFNIYELFDYNIAYEIRLYDALRENLLVPFHYFGISDIVVDGETINDKTSINKLTVDERVNNIIEKSRFYGYSGDILHGLIFVSRIEEAKILAQKMTEKGVKAIALVGEHSDFYREQVIKWLEDGEINYIITVDIFNEGIDIPCVNQIILLRPTQSSIVYIQQLGRGLRKYPEKEYVVVLDFIGNYEKNFLIPVAVSQNSSYDKDYLKRFIMNGTDMIPGESSISFEEIAKEKIFENINKTNFSTKKNIEADFNLLEKQLGRTPMLYDFFQRNMIDPSVILKYKKTYDEVLRIMRPKEKFGNINEVENNYLRFLSGFFTPAKRVHEIEAILYMIQYGKLYPDEFNRYIEEKYKLINQKESSYNSLKHLSKEIFVSLSTVKEYLPIFVRYEDYFVFSEDFMQSYKINSYFKFHIDDLLKYNLAYAVKNYRQQGIESILKYKEYSKQESFWYLNLDFNNGYQVSGYTVFESEKKIVLFVTLDDEPPFTLYDNKFFDNQRFTWYSKERRCLSRNGELTIEGKIAENYYTLEAFIKKKSGENFYYLGQVEKVLNPKEITNYKGNQVVEYELKLKSEIDSTLFEYLMRNI